jgi:hypothetical protein
MPYPFSTGISDTVPRRFFFLQTGSNTDTITRHHYHHFPTLSLEHLSLSLRSNLVPHSLLTYSILDHNYLGPRLYAISLSLLLMRLVILKYRSLPEIVKDRKENERFVDNFAICNNFSKIHFHSTN